MVTSLELLAPAGDVAIGIAAIDHGADAVYIGAPKFSARAAAGVQLDDIARLIEHAHFYRAKVYVALNTILTDSELAESLDLIRAIDALGAESDEAHAEVGDALPELAAERLGHRGLVVRDLPPALHPDDLVAEEPARLDLNAQVGKAVADLALFDEAPVRSVRLACVLRQFFDLAAARS